MRIKDIPFKKVKKAAKKNRANWPSLSISYKADKHLETAYAWCRTPEGQQFWCHVNRRRWDEAREICPHLFDVEESKIYKTRLVDGITDKEITIVSDTEYKIGQSVRVGRVFYCVCFSEEVTDE